MQHEFIPRKSFARDASGSQFAFAFPGVFDEDMLDGIIRRVTSPLNYPRDVGLVEQGSLPGEVYYIESGLVKLVHLEQDGQELIVNLRSSGCMIGTSAAILNKPMPVSAVTLTACQLRRIPCEEFLRFVRTSGRFASYILQVQSSEVFDQVRRLAQLGCLSAQDRLKHFVKQLVSTLKPPDEASEIRFELPLKRWEIAQLIGVTPEHISRMLKQLHQEGVLRLEKGWVIISRPESMLGD
jgi:CRP/FNR family transcriptional regulator